MKRTKICLSVASIDAAFERMRDALSALADVTVCGLDGYSLDGVDIFIGKKLNAEKLADANALRAVFAYKTGVDDFPLAALAARGVAVYNSHVNSEYIAEYAFALAAALTARIVESDRRMRLGDWAMSDRLWRSVFNMTVGLVGYGGIGRAVHDVLRKNGIDCVTLDRGKAYDGIRTVKTLDELCAACDLLILSLPKTPETDGMFDSRVLGLLKGKYIVNVGRGNCIDERALYEALVSRSLAGAAIDAWREKPTGDEKLLPFDVPLETLDNIILSPHKAMFIADGHERYVLDVLDNVAGYLGGKPPRNRVDLTAGY